MHIAWPVLLKICLLLAVATLLILFAAAVAGLGWPEGVVLAILAVLLLGRRLPTLAYWLGYRIVHRV